MGEGVKKITFWGFVTYFAIIFNISDIRIYPDIRDSHIRSGYINTSFDYKSRKFFNVFGISQAYMCNFTVYSTCWIYHELVQSIHLLSLAFFYLIRPLVFAYPAGLYLANIVHILKFHLLRAAVVISLSKLTFLIIIVFISNSSIKILFNSKDLVCFGLPWPCTSSKSLKKFAGGNELKVIYFTILLFKLKVIYFSILLFTYCLQVIFFR